MKRGENVELLTRAALSQGDVCGRPALPDGTRILELPVQFYFQRATQFTAAAGAANTDTAYQFFHPTYQFVLRSIQYSNSGDWEVIFSNGRVLMLPSILADTVGTGPTGRLDTTGTASDKSAGGIVIDPCDRVTMSGTNFQESGGAFQVQASVLFIGVLRIFLKSGKVQPPYPGPIPEPRALFTANQNLYAEQTRWGFQCYPETPEGFSDELFWVVCPSVTVLVSGGVSGVSSGQVLLPGDADFVWREWDFQVLAVSGATGAPVCPIVRFRTQNGEAVSDDLVDAYSCQGPAFPETVLPRGSYVSYDVSLQNVGGDGSVVVQFFLFGVRRFRQ